MSRSYSLAVAAFAIDAETKWLDNLVARHDIPGVARSGRGVELAISGSGLLVVAVVRRLVADIGLSAALALPLARKLVTSPEGAAHAGGPFTIRLDRRAVERELEARLVEAADAIAPRRRGRPPRRRPRAG